jgi:hypothetical protein
MLSPVRPNMPQCGRLVQHLEVQAAWERVLQRLAGTDLLAHDHTLWADAKQHQHRPSRVTSLRQMLQHGNCSLPHLWGAAPGAADSAKGDRTALPMYSPLLKGCKGWPPSYRYCQVLGTGAEQWQLEAAYHLLPSTRLSTSRTNKHDRGCTAHQPVLQQ